MKKNQKGSALIGLAIAIAIIGGLLVQGLPLINQWRHNEEAQTLKKQVSYLWELTKLYQADRFNAGMQFDDLNTLPASVDALMPDYLPTCTVAMFEQGTCKRIDYTPIGERITLQREFITLATGNTVPGMRIVVPFVNEPTQAVLNTYLAALNDLPGGEYNSTSKQFSVRFGRIGSEVEHEALVARDGSKTLTGSDWDTGGNTWITNIKGLFLRNQDGSQRSVAAGLENTVTVSSGTYIPDYSCPAGHTADLNVAVSAIEPQSSSTRFSALGSFSTYKRRSGAGWVVGLQYYAKAQGTDNWYNYTGGFVTVTMKCVI